MNRAAIQQITSSRKTWRTIPWVVLAAWLLKEGLYLMAAPRWALGAQLLFATARGNGHQQRAPRPASLALALCRSLPGVGRTVSDTLFASCDGAKGITGSKLWWSHAKSFKVWRDFCKGVCSLMKNICCFHGWPLNLREVDCLKPEGTMKGSALAPSRALSFPLRLSSGITGVKAMLFCLKYCVPLLAPAVVRENGITCNPNSCGTDNEITHLLQLCFRALPQIIKGPSD